MTQLVFFRSNSERYESKEDTFDISKIQIDLEPNTLQRELLMRNVSRINALPSDTYIMYKTGSLHRDFKKYPGNTYPYLYDYSTNRQISIVLTRTTYPSICIPMKFVDNRKLMMVFHRLVAMCFLPNDDPNHKITVDHLDEDKLNYSLDNLEWASMSENTRRRKKNND